METTRETIIEDIKRVAKDLNQKQLFLSEFRTNSDISDYFIWRLFDSWNEAIKESGLIPHTEKEKINIETLFNEMEKVFVTYGGICTRTRFEQLSKYSTAVYRKRFGSWHNILKAYRNWVVRKKHEFPFLNQLPLNEKNPKIDLDVAHTRSEPKKKETKTWDTIGSTKYGPLLNFRGLQHAPIDEQDVIFLFAIIFSELGFVIESIRTEYPDCEAKRRIHKTKDRWERVKIEFEFKSSNFKKHGHDPEQCDLIVCWIDDWKKCPIEVLELESVIKKLPSD